MPASLSISAVPVDLLSEGIRFLYSQASDALKKLREAKKTGYSPDDTVAAGHSDAPGIFDGELKPLLIHLGATEDLEEDLREVRAHLLDYATGAATINPADAYALGQVTVLRNMMEAVYGQRITFKGEQGREPSGTSLTQDFREMRNSGYFDHDTTVYDSSVPTPVTRQN